MLSAPRRGLGNLEHHGGDPGFFPLRFIGARRTHGDGDLIGQCLQDEAIIGAECAYFGALHVQHAEYFALDDERHGDLRARIGQEARVIGDIARLERYVVCQQWFAVLRHPADNAFAPDGEGAAFDLPLLIELMAGTRLELCAVGSPLDQKHLHMIIAEPGADRFDHLGEQRVQIEDTRDLTADFRDGHQRVKTLLAVFVEPGVGEGRRRLVGKHGEHPQVTLVEDVARGLCTEIAPMTRSPASMGTKMAERGGRSLM